MMLKIIKWKKNIESVNQAVPHASELEDVLDREESLFLDGGGGSCGRGSCDRSDTRHEKERGKSEKDDGSNARLHLDPPVAERIVTRRGGSRLAPIEARGHGLPMSLPSYAVWPQHPTVRGQRLQNTYPTDRTLPTANQRS